MGRVWLARDEMLRREVAIKEIALPFGLSDDEHDELRQRTLREARAAARLSHPNVVQIYDVINSEAQPWIVMEYVRSRSLLQVIKEHGPLPIEQVARIGLNILSALEAANRAGVLHRDVKPSNVLIADDGRVVLTDFGSAILDDTEGAITRTGVILGSPQYIAPERARNGISTAESDLWSLGATMYAAAEGRSPFSRPTVLGTLIAVATERPDPVQRAGALKPVLLGLLQKTPRSRMSAFEVERRLRRVAGLPAHSQRLVPILRPAREATTVDIRAIDAAHAPAAIEASPAKASDAVAALSQLARPRDTAPPSETKPAAPPRRRSQAEAPKAAAGEVEDKPRLNARRRRPSWQWAVAGVTTAALLAVGAVAVASDRLDRTAATTQQQAGGGNADGAKPEVANAAPQTDQQAVPAVPAGPNLDLPAGLAWWFDQSGWTVARPANWRTLREGPAAMFFCEPGGPKTLRVHTWRPASDDLVTAFVQEEANTKKDHMTMSYKRLRIDTMPRNEGVEWEYLITDEMGQLHGIERGFYINGQPYLLQWRVPVPEWQGQLNTFDTIMQSFQPRQRNHVPTV